MHYIIITYKNKVKINQFYNFNEKIIVILVERNN